MRLYSIQPLWVYQHLAQGETYQARPRREAEHWLNDPEGWFGKEKLNPTLLGYEWLCSEMEKRGLLRPHPEVFPVWAYQQWAGRALPRPDLRYGCMKSWAEKERHVLMTLEVDEARVLLSDYDAWHACLNYWYLGRTRESNTFERRCKALGLSPYRDKPLPQPDLHAELVRSWERIFELDSAPALLGCRKRDQCVQATFWELRPRDVVHAVEFGAGWPAQRVPRPAGAR